MTGLVHLRNPKNAVLKEYWMLAAWRPFTISKFGSKSNSAERMVW